MQPGPWGEEQQRRTQVWLSLSCSCHAPPACAQPPGLPFGALDVGNIAEEPWQELVELLHRWPHGWRLAHAGLQAVPGGCEKHQSGWGPAFWLQCPRNSALTSDPPRPLPHRQLRPILLYPERLQALSSSFCLTWCGASMGTALQGLSGHGPKVLIAGPSPLWLALQEA